MTDIEEKDQPTGLEIAVIGMAARFPGAQNIDEFWANLHQGIETISFFSQEELIAAGLNAGLVNNPDYVGAKGMLAEVEYFDARFFDYSPKETEVMDPQVRAFHECAWEALEHAGYVPYSYKGLIGLYAGASSSLQWEVLSYRSGKAQALGGYAASMLANKDYLNTRISYKLNLKGPSLTVQTTCSTSLVAIHQGCRALLTGECDMALAGGVTVSLPRKGGYMYQEGMINSPDGHCRAFDAAAAGTVAGEGVGVVVLKRLDAALADGDEIWAVIKGSAVNNDGNRKVGYTAPSVEGQEEVIRAALEMAEVEADNIGYIEGHGTGTSLGDPIEMEALKRVFQTDHRRQSCALGSVKSNVGHLDSAAGVAGFMKAVLTLKYRLIPPSLHFENPNPKLGIDDSPFYINTELKAWQADGKPLRAGVSSFGVGGTNAHVVLEEAPARESSPPGQEWQILPLSARSESALDNVTANLANYLEGRGHINPADLAYTLQKGRQPFSCRRLAVCKDIDDAISQLSGRGRQLPAFTVKKENPPVVFLFSGQGSQYVNMARELYEGEPLFRQEMDRCFEILKPLMAVDLKAVIYPPEPAGTVADINATAMAQPALFVLEYALAKCLLAWGIRPFAMQGHSIGEFTAACLSGVFSLEDALRLVVLRGKLMQDLPGGSMMSIRLEKQKLLPLLKDEDLALASVNSPVHCVVSGAHETVKRFSRLIEAQGCEYRFLHTSHAFHSVMMEPIMVEFERAVGEVARHQPGIPYISNVTGQWITVEDAVSPAYWSRHLRSTVRFADGLAQLAQAGGTIFVEVGPGTALSTFVKQVFEQDRDYSLVQLVRHPRKKVSDLYHFRESVGKLWLYGRSIDWSALYGEERRVRIPLPTYPFERRFYWPESSGADEAPVYQYERPELSTKIVLPRTAAEEALQKIIKDYFGFREIGVEDDFFELGADSVQVITVSSRIHKELNIKIPVAEFFARPTIAGLADYIEHRGGGDTFAAIEPAEEREFYPLSAAQRSMFVLQQLNPQSLSYNLPQVYGFSGPLDRERFEQAFRLIIQRHRSLRTSFRVLYREAVQIVHEGVDFFPRCTDAADDKVESMFYEFVRPFDLSRAPLVRVELVRVGADRHVWFFDIHHIVGDATAIAALQTELFKLYNGETLAPLKLQYTDFCCWQHKRAERGELKEQEAYWLNLYGGDIPVLDLPGDYPRPEVPSFAGDVYPFTLPPDQTTAFKKLISRRGATMYMGLLSAFYILLQIYSGQDDIIVGTAIFGRPHDDLRQMVGMFANMLALRNSLDPGQTFGQLLQQVKENTLAAFANQDVYFEKLVDDLKLDRDSSRNPLFNVGFYYQNYDRAKVGMKGMEMKPYMLFNKASKFDMTLWANEVGDEIHFSLEYSTDLFKESTMKKFARRFIEIVEQLNENPDIRLQDIKISHRFRQTQAAAPAMDFKF